MSLLAVKGNGFIALILSTYYLICYLLPYHSQFYLICPIADKGLAVGQAWKYLQTYIAGSFESQPEGKY